MTVFVSYVGISTKSRDTLYGNVVYAVENNMKIVNLMKVSMT